MTNQQITETVQSILIRHFNIQADQFSLEQPLEVLQDDFKILSNLVLLEQLLSKEFNKDILLLDNISTAFHTPKDIINLIISDSSL